MIPAFIKRVLMITGLLVFVVWAYLAVAVQWRTAAYFLVSALWAMANLVAWSFLILSATSREMPARSLKVTGAVLLKLMILVGGPVALLVCRPGSAGEVFAILAGISSVVVITLLKAIGAWLVGSDMFEGRRALMSRSGTGKK